MMDLDKTYTQQDIEQLIGTGSEESSYLEFKRGEALAKDDKKRLEITKDVSAFANADGGVLIYGITEENHVANSYSFIDGNTITKEWLEQVINGGISRRPEYTIDPIRVDNDLQKTLYVVRIPRSDNAPHMAKDNIYYKRRNFEVEKMEEYDVRDTYNRISKSVLQFEPSTITAPAGSTYQENKYFYYTAKVDFTIRNISKVIETLYKMEIWIPRQLALQSDVGIQNFFKNSFRDTEEYRIISIPGTSPLFKDEIMKMATVELVISPDILEAPKTTTILKKLFYSGGYLDDYIILKKHLKNKNGKSLKPSDFRK